MRTHVDLYSGIGGFSLACEWAGVETIAFAEVDPYASRVLKRHWPGVRNYGDVRGFPRLSAWLLTAGVPCQPASVAGKRKGAADDRWLWPETLAVVENGSYEWLLFENPTGILSLNDGLEFERICAALESKGYEVQPLVIPACGIGALHRRNRAWIVAHSISEQLRSAGLGSVNGTQGGVEREERQQRIRADIGERGSNVAHAKRGGRGESAGTVTSARQSFRASLGEEGALESGSGGEAMAHADNARPQRRIGGELRECPGEFAAWQSGASVPNATRERIDRSGNGGARWRPEFTNGDWWSVEPDVGRLADGVSDRVGKLRCLGNAIVPQVAYQIIKRMIEAETHRG